MNCLIDKTTYLEYLECAQNAWLKLYKPELKHLFGVSEFDKNLSNQGCLVEAMARLLFPSGLYIAAFGNDAVELTQKYIAAKVPFIFQSTFISSQFLARNDVLAYNAVNGTWDLYEIKATSSLEENAKKINHIEDVSFQVVILKDLGIEIGKIFLVRLNKEYVLEEELDTQSLFVPEDITEKVQIREIDTRLHMQKAKMILLQDDETPKCLCIYRSRCNHCSTFYFSHNNVPEYSVHDISRISTMKIQSLVDEGILKIEDIPDQFKLTDIQTNQVRACKTGIPIIRHHEIATLLDNLQYPLYFLDYETYASAIPKFKGYTPYEPITFQMSLHVLNSLDSEPEHFEYLHTEDSDPSIPLLQRLQEIIGLKGSIIVWRKSFERDRNEELARRNPDYKYFLSNLNARLFDLMEIFSKQMYVHAGFRGSSSIKKVLPILVPDLRYDELCIQEGGIASQAWCDMIWGKLEKNAKQKIAGDLKAYCRLDTYAMYTIWKYIYTEAKKHVFFAKSHTTSLGVVESEKI